MPEKADIFAVIFVGMALRAIVSLHLYSGAATPPMFGDYEAQRHWQEITASLPPQDWYRNTTWNDLNYWGLDYPPLTAYHSKLVGTFAQRWNSSFIELKRSRGIESADHKSFMRLSVLVADAFVYVPAALTLALAMDKAFDLNMYLPVLILFMLYPGQVLVDNGHFQYNNISLGFAMFAMAAILHDRVYSAALFFTLALNYKQMELYHALPFFVYLLHVCLSKKRFVDRFSTFITIAAVVVGTFATLWFPWLHSIDALKSVVTRLFPIGRGLFEDKVANFWCAVDIFYKLRQNVASQNMAFLCLACTLLAIAPVNATLFTKGKKDNFLYCLTYTALSFFLFSFHVHEKSILLVAIPAICLFVFKPLEVLWFLEVTVFSMLPLFIKDGLALATFAMYAIFQLSMNMVCQNACSSWHKSTRWKVFQISRFIMFALSLITLYAPVPVNLPFLWSLMVAMLSFSHFLLFNLGIFCEQVYPNFLRFSKCLKME